MIKLPENYKKISHNIHFYLLKWYNVKEKKTSAEINGGNSMAHILVVDDEMNIRRVVREYAEFEGHQVTEAENGIEAVNLCHDTDFDLIIMDVMMPEA